MRSPLADRLRRHALTLVDPSVRAALYRTIAAEVDDDELREAVVSLTAASAQGDVGARVAFQSLLIALSAAPERQRAVGVGDRSPWASGNLWRASPTDGCSIACCATRTPT
jgi:hypothetical protein